jgi:hypothetical protein
LGKNIDPLIFREFINELHKRYEQKDDADEPFIS